MKYMYELCVCMYVCMCNLFNYTSIEESRKKLNDSFGSLYELLLLEPLENAKLLLSGVLEVIKSLGILFRFLSMLATAGEVEDATKVDEIGRLLRF